MTRVCIYCLETKDDTAFNREHVIPQSYGTFDGNNLVLDCVCRECNTFFGRQLDEALACDTLEAIDRYRVGLKSPKKLRTLGKRSRVYSRIENGPLKGAYVHHVASPDGDGLAVALSAQIGIRRSADADFEWYRPDDVPGPNDPRRGKRGERIAIQVQGMPIEEAIAILRRLEYGGLDDLERLPPPDGRARVETIGRIESTDCRAAAKIAFNYLAAVTNGGIARMPQFDEVRRYIRDGERGGERIVDVAPNRFLVDRTETEKPAMGHYVAVQTLGAGVVAQVSLLQRFRYVVALARGAFVIPLRVNRAHFFDVETRTISEIPAPPLAITVD